MAVVQYNTVGVKLDIHIDDFFIVNGSFANRDLGFVDLQGSNDVYTVMTSYDANNYYVGSFKRKFSTGDVNRDITLLN